MYDILLAFDGGSNDNVKIGKTGSVIYDILQDTFIENTRVYSDVTNNFTELKAFAEGLDIIAKTYPRNSKLLNILVIGDSQYVLKAFKEWVHRWAKAGANAQWYSTQGVLLNQELIKYIYYNYITEHYDYKFNFLHVKGHLSYTNQKDIEKMSKHFKGQGYDFGNETVRTIIKLNNIADALSSCVNIDRDGNPLK